MTTRVELQWSPSTEQDLAGYKITWDSSDPHDKPKVLMLQKGVTRLTLDVVLKRHKVYTFSVQAFDIAGNDSTPTILQTWYKE